MAGANTGSATPTTPRKRRRRSRVKSILETPAFEIRFVRFIVILTLVFSTVYAGYLILTNDSPLVQENKLEIGMVLGWLIAKASTAVDWLLGGSEGGNRLTSVMAQRSSQAPPEGSTTVSATPGGTVSGTAGGAE